MRFLADENFPGAAVAALREAGHDLSWVSALAPGMPDIEVLAWARREDRILLTFDKDFGELAIRPYAEGGVHEATNGVLLRRDIHSLFDAGYVTITPSLDFEVSSRIREEYENGRLYYALHGQRIARPDDPRRRPDASALAWHNETVFRR